MLYIQAPFGRGSTTPLSQGIRTSNLRCDWSSFNHDSPPAAIGRLAAPLCHRRPIGCRKRESIVSHCCLCGPDIGVVCVRVSWKEQQSFAQRKQILTPAKRHSKSWPNKQPRTSPNKQMAANHSSIKDGARGTKGERRRRSPGHPRPPERACCATCHPRTSIQILRRQPNSRRNILGNTDTPTHLAISHKIISGNCQ